MSEPQTCNEHKAKDGTQYTVTYCTKYCPACSMEIQLEELEDELARLTEIIEETRCR